MSSANFEPAEGGEPDGAGRASVASARKARKQRKLRRKFASAALLVGGLLAAGGVATIASPTPQVAIADDFDAAQVENGKRLYETSCISCHGASLEGVKDRGPSLVGVGDSAVYFQVHSGRMPATVNSSQIVRKPAKFDAKQIDAMGAYIQSIGGGPSIVWEYNPDGSIKRDENGNRVIAQESLRGKNLGAGAAPVRRKSAAWHNKTRPGGARSGGPLAPPRAPAPPGGGAAPTAPASCWGGPALGHLRARRPPGPRRASRGSGRTLSPLCLHETRFRSVVVPPA